MLLQSGTYQPRVRPADPHGCSCHGLKTRRSQEAVKPAQKHLQLQGYDIMPTSPHANCLTADCRQISGDLDNALPCRRQYGLKCRAAVEAVEETVEDDVPNDQKIRIKLKSYWVDRLTMSVEKIRDAARSTNAKFSGPVYLPTR